MKIRTLQKVKLSGNRFLAEGFEFEAEISDNKLVANIQVDDQPFPLMIGRDCEIIQELPRETGRESLKREFYAHAVLELAKANRIARPTAASSEVIGVAKADADAYIKAIGL